VLALMNERTQAAVATDVELASTRATRRRGLLGRDSLAPTAALMLTPCVAVHTAFMRFPIDIVFLDRDGRAVKLVSDVGPWRMAGSKRARTVIEMAAGSLRRHAIALGDRLYLRQ
jgi:uncharacterized membrane protein (UPF0127 family)